MDNLRVFRRQLRPAFHNMPDNASLAAIWAKYERLCQLREEAHEFAAGSRSCSNSTASFAEVAERFVDQIESSLCELAWLSVDVQARDGRDIERKTRILTDCMVHQSSDVVTALAESLRRDAMRIG